MMKGAFYSLEALIAISIILLAIVNLFPRNQLAGPPRELKQLAEDSLKSLDSAGLLREPALRNDTTTIRNLLSDILPLNTEYSVTVCMESCPSIKLPDNRNVFTSTYYISGAGRNYTATEIVLNVWEKS